MPFGGQLQRRRAALASWVALAVAVGGVVTYAVQADGYQSHKAELNDGGIWVTSKKDGSYGRINKPIGELDGAIFSRLDSNLDVVQDGSSVVGVNLTDGVVVPLDPAQMQVGEDQEASIPGSPAVGMAGGSLAVLDSVTGKLWATREDPSVGLPAVTPLANQSDPVATVGADAALAVSLDGTVFAASSASDELVTLRQVGDDAFADATTDDLPGQKFSDAIALTAVGAVPVVLDSATGRLAVIGGVDAEVPKGSVLQQPGPSASSVLVGAQDGLLSIDLATGNVTTITKDVGGDPAMPVRLGDCQYGAWSGGTGSVVTVCGDGEATPQALDAQTSDLVFRVNRGQIVLNDRSSGNVWDIDSDQPTRLDNWDAFRLKSEDKKDDDDQNQQDQGDRRPPKAKNDSLGARPGRTTILHPLDNDTAPSGRLLAIRSVRAVSGAPGQLAISPDGQTVQISLPADAAGGTSFQYFIDDGRQSVSAHATVRVAIAASAAQNSEPELREGFEPRIWTVPSSGTIDVPVLSDWRDPHDGDPVSTLSAEPQGAAAGADARITAAGAVRFHAPAQGGLVKVDYDVTDGLGQPVTESLAFRVQDPNDLDGVAPVAEPDVIAGETGKPVVVTPLANDLPGADPSTPDAVLRLAGKVAQVPGAQVVTNLAKGTITVRSNTAQTYFLDYQAAYGTAETATGKIRVDVRAPENPPLDPVAVPDTVTLFGQAASLVDVLANDVDPSGGLLSVQRVDPVNANQLDVAVVSGRWLRVSARQGALTPNPQLIRYTISNGRTSDVVGQVVVSQRPLPADNTPVTQNDEVTVRAGSSQAIPVLDNDYSPSGGALTLVNEGLGDQSGSLDVQPLGASGSAASGPVGSAYVTGRTVRYVAPDVKGPQRFTIRYQAENEQGDSAAGKVRVTVLPLRERDNQAPEPPVLEGRTVSGDTVKLRLPGYGVDPDGDAVTILGLDSAPALGRVTRIGANSIEYNAYPSSHDTDEFTYTVIDSLGATATGTARISITPPGPPQPPLAVPDSITVAPGRTAVVDVLANDLVATGSRVTLTLVDPPRGVRLRTPTGPLELDAPANGDGRNVEVVYRVNDGLDSSQATVTLRTLKGYNNPPIVSDAFGAVGDGANITADVLSAGTETSGSTSGAYDPDGPFEDLRVTDVYAPPGIFTRIDGGNVTVERADQPMVVPFRVEDADGGAATGSLYVPAATSGMPFVIPGASIELKPGRTIDAQLSDYVENPSGGRVGFTLKNRMSASPRGRLEATITGDGTFRVEADPKYSGPGAVVFEVTTGTSVDDPDGIKAILSVPVQVGETKPILKCPEDPIEVPQAESVRIDLAALCHVWTANPDQVAGLSWTAGFDDGSASGLVAATPQAGVVEVTASAATDPGDTGTLRVAADNSSPGRVNIRVIATPPPSLAPIRVSTLKAGESQTIDLARYLTPGVREPVPTVVSAEQLTNLDVQITTSGSSVTITTGSKVHGHAEFRVVMSDVAAVDSGPGRRVQGRIALDVLGPPSVPGVPVPGNEVKDAKVSLDWRAAESNGSPIDYYEVQNTSGGTIRCRTNSCDFTGLRNGTSYRFRVRAHNAVGFSDWSGLSASKTPDETPEIFGKVTLVQAGDGFLHIRWNPVKGKNGGEIKYFVKWQGNGTTSFDSDLTVSGLDNHQRYTFTITPQNGFIAGGALTSAAFQPIGPPGQPGAPVITDQETPGSSGAVTLTWDAVDPNGPGGLRYTVFRDGAPLPSCTKISQTSCDNANLAYNGAVYAYTVQAYNKDGRTGSVASLMSGPSQWKAAGRPASWGGWTLTATGTNNQAKAVFTVPPSRGAESRVNVYADGTKVQSLVVSGDTETMVDVANNAAPHTVVLEVCNEKGACTQSAARTVQTYGPLVGANIHSITPNIDGTRISWTIEADGNGDDATLTVVSDRGRSEQFTVPVGVGSFTTTALDLGYRQTETVTVTLADSSPVRGPVSATNAGTTAEPPPPAVTGSRGAACNDDPAAGLPACDSGLFGGPKCTDASCAFVHIVLSNWVDGVPGQAVFCSVNNANGRPYNPNTNTDTPDYFGSPGQTVTIHCENGAGQSADTQFVW